MDISNVKLIFAKYMVLLSMVFDKNEMSKHCEHLSNANGLKRTLFKNINEDLLSCNDAQMLEILQDLPKN